MRWYQQSVQGTKPATSEKYRLPAVASAATSQPAVTARPSIERAMAA